jgi:hypothetical protein
MTDKEKRDYVQKIWTDPAHPASFSGPEKVYQIIRKEGRYNIRLGTIKKMLSNKETYTVQKPARQKFPRSRVIVSGLNAQWDGDLCSMQNVARVNDDVNFLLLLIDIFSRFLIVKPLKDKKSSIVANAIKSVLEEHSNYSLFALFVLIKEVNSNQK